MNVPLATAHKNLHITSRVLVYTSYLVNVERVLVAVQHVDLRVYEALRHRVFEHGVAVLRRHEVLVELAGLGAVALVAILAEDLALYGSTSQYERGMRRGLLFQVSLSIVCSRSGCASFAYTTRMSVPLYKLSHHRKPPA